MLFRHQNILKFAFGAAISFMFAFGAAFVYPLLNKSNTFENLGYLTKSTSEYACTNCKPIERKTPPPRDSIAIYSQERILRLAQKNPCYLPLIQDATYWSPEFDSTKFIHYSDLFNTAIDIHKSLPDTLSYNRRYLVADLMVLNEDSTIKGSREFYPTIDNLFDWQSFKSDWMREHMMHPLYHSDSVINILRDSLSDYLNNGHPIFTAEDQMNFFEKIWRYHGKPIEKTYSVSGNSVYASGQQICMCEAYWDTLQWVGSVAVSSKRLGIHFTDEEDGSQTSTTYSHLPTGRIRDYYGGSYTISSKFWERRRAYEALDRRHDSIMGGGHHRIVRYKNRVELPNFLTILPTEDYPGAMLDNGIHEVSLRQMPRNMLGTSNSIGCLRVSDYVSKFLRWWVPQDCHLYVAYQPHRYHYQIPADDHAFFPINTQEEGDQFRAWVNDNYPFYAKQVNLGRTGEFKNGYIRQAYLDLGNEFEQREKHSH